MPVIAKMQEVLWFTSHTVAPRHRQGYTWDLNQNSQRQLVKKNHLKGWLATFRTETDGGVLLMTCQVVVQGPNGSIAQARALLDSGSEASFNTERLYSSATGPVLTSWSNDHVHRGNNNTHTAKRSGQHSGNEHATLRKSTRCPGLSVDEDHVKYSC